MEKGNDHCAYCRKDMIKPQELLLAAREELGDARVDKIVKINELAAQRIAAYEASMALDANNTDISRQLASSGSLSLPVPTNDGTATATVTAAADTTPTSTQV